MSPVMYAENLLLPRIQLLRCAVMAVPSTLRVPVLMHIDGPINKATQPISP